MRWKTKQNKGRHSGLKVGPRVKSHAVATLDPFIPWEPAKSIPPGLNLDFDDGLLSFFFEQRRIALQGSNHSRSEASTTAYDATLKEWARRIDAAMAAGGHEPWGI